MDIILSHDVDHITVWEHWKDPIIPKFLVRSKLELLLGRITFGELMHRYGDLFHNRWQNLQAVMDLDRSYSARSCFFFGMDNGLGLSYPLKQAERWIPEVMARGFDVGVHGIAFEDQKAMALEHARFKRISGLENFGVRMHYLRRSEGMLAKLAAIGYTFDATESGISTPRKEHGIWEFPVQEMDVWALCGTSRYQKNDRATALAHTESRIQEAERAGLPYFSLLFHDSYYSPSFATWKAWYEGVLENLSARGHRFVGYNEAMARLSATVQGQG